MNKIDVLLIISSLAFTLSFISTILGLVALIKIVAAEKSTHTLTYQPVDEEIERANKEVMENWSKQSQSWVAEDQKNFKEDLEENFPEFLNEEEEDGAISF